MAAYDNEIDFASASEAIQSDLIDNALDIASLEQADTLDGVSVVIARRVKDGKASMVNIPVSLLTAASQDAAASARTAAINASQAAGRAQSAVSAAEGLTQQAEALLNDFSDAVENLKGSTSDYIEQATAKSRRELEQLAQMVESGDVRVSMQSVQLFEDYKAATGFTGSYDDFLALIGRGGGGGSVDVDSELSMTSTNPVQNKAITGALGEKQDTLEYMTVSEVHSEFDKIFNN